MRKSGKRHSGTSAKTKGRIFNQKQGLILTSMLDILVTILFFLLKNFSHTTTNFNLAADLKLPYSSTLQNPPDSSLQLVVSTKALLLDDKELVPIVNGTIPKEALYRDGITIVPLAQALQAHKKRSQFVAERNDQHSFTGTVVLQADKDLQYSLLKKVVYTAGITDFVNLKLAVIKEEK